MVSGGVCGTFAVTVPENRLRGESQGVKKGSSRVSKGLVEES